MMYLWVAMGGAIGASGRFFVTSMTGRLIGHGFPWGTMIVNIVGSFIMGALISLMAIKWSTSNELRAFLTTGVLGGFTTFSAFSLDFVTLYERKEMTAAFGYAAGSVGLSLLAVFAGLVVVRMVLS
jgi:CrcB protein